MAKWKRVLSHFNQTLEQFRQCFYHHHVHDLEGQGKAKQAIANVLILLNTIFNIDKNIHLMIFPYPSSEWLTVYYV
jgi:hypothetical protein